MKKIFKSILLVGIMMLALTGCTTNKSYTYTVETGDKFKILTEINDIQPKINELRNYDKYCKDIKERSELIQNNLNNFDKDMQKEKDNIRSY